mgnify:CR=1 FL=1
MMTQNSVNPAPTSSSPPRPVGRLAALWQKYGLIVVGNIVFFLLLYFFSYRPHNAEARASELLQLAQNQETDARLEAAEVLYGKLIADYPDTRAGEVASERLPGVLEQRSAREAAARRRVPLPPQPFDWRKLLDKEPAWAVAGVLADRWPEVDDSARERYLVALDRYVELAFAAGLQRDSLARHSAFATGVLRSRYLDLHGHCRVQGDWVYDDVAIINDNLFAWHNVVVDVAVGQGDDRSEAAVRAAEVGAAAALPLTELRVSKDGGFVHCRLRVKADEGELLRDQRL